MIFITRDNTILRRAVQYITGLNGVYEIEIREYTKKRSNPQNAFYWGVVLKVFGDFMGESPENLHLLFRQRLLGCETKTIQGTEITELKSTTSLTTKEFTDYIDKIRFTASEMGCEIPLPEDFGLGDAANPCYTPPGMQR